MKRLLKGLYVIVGTYLMLAALITFFQRTLIYQPQDSVPVLAAHNLSAFSEITYKTADGLLQHAWHARAEAQKPTFLVFHGNAGDLAQRAVFAGFLQQNGYGVLLVSYRGYPPNGGTPTEQDIYADALAARAWLNTSGVADKDIVVFGGSLGSGPATWLASRMAEEGRPAHAVVLEVPLSTMADVAQYHYWYIPVKPLLIDRFDNMGRIACIKAPLLIIAAEQDDVVPNRFAKRLFDVAQEPKQFVMTVGAQHNNVLTSNPAHFKIVTDFIGTLP